MRYQDYRGEKISALGFGCMRLPVLNNDQSQIDMPKVEEMLLYAYEHGVNYYDTAFPYHNGFRRSRSERSSRGTTFATR